MRYLPEKVALSIRWKTNESILFGAGAGLPMGCMSGGSVVTVAKESGQATQTLSPQNLAKMISRLPSGSFGRAVWIINNDVLPALFTLTLGNYPIYLPNGLAVGGIQVSPYGTLLGRPVIVSQHANTFSSLGDVLLVDLSYYQTITKAGGMQTATSMHLYFDADMTAFRTTFRMDGQSKIAGLDQLAEALRALPQRVARNGLRAAVYAGAKVIRDEAKLMAPMATAALGTNQPPLSQGQTRSGLVPARAKPRIYGAFSGATNSGWAPVGAFSPCGTLKFVSILCWCEGRSSHN